MGRTFSILFCLVVLLPTPAGAADKPVDLSKDKVLYVVGYAHLDTQWRWDYPTTIRHYIPATLRENFKLFETYPEYVFNFTGSIRYGMMEEYYPQDFAKLKDYVVQGRWKVAGSSVDESDANVPSAESIVRQILYGNDYFRKTFGRDSVDFMLPDCFGFPASLPSILSHCGLKGFVTQKLTWGSAVGVPFNVGVWEGPDGGSVVAVLNPGAYVHRLRTDLSRDPQWQGRIDRLGDETGVFADYHFYGVGDRGGAPDPKSVEWLTRSVTGDGPIRVVAASTEQLFRDLQPEGIARLPRYRGDLLLTEHSAGTLTSQASMKRWNRKNELLADAAERASVIADWLGGAPYPRQKLRSRWLRVLASQMHDILPGTSIPSAYDYSWNDEVLALNGFAAVVEDAIGAATRALDTRVAGIAVVIFNPLAMAREDIVAARLDYPKGPPKNLRVYDAGGREVPSQVKTTGTNLVEICFLARAPSVGLAVYDVRPADEPCRLETGLSAARDMLENRRYRVRLDEHGDVASIYDKAAHRELLAAPARLELLTDSPQNWPAWNMDWKDLEAAPRAHVRGPAAVRVTETGPARVSIEVVREAESSRFSQSIRLGAGAAGDRVEFDSRVDWHTAGTCLKAGFPLTVSDSEATYNLGVGTIRRGNNDAQKYEVPSHQWFDVTDTDGEHGVAILEDCKYGSDKPADHKVRLTLLRTPECRSYPDQASQDLGFHAMLYAVASHVGDWRTGHVPWHAARLNQPLLAFRAPRHPGPLKGSATD